MISNDQIINDGSTTFSQLQDAFANAASLHLTGCRQLNIRCAGHSIRLRTAGNKLARQLAQAFGHLLHPTESDPELTIEIWDAAESGVQLRSDFHAQRKLTGFVTYVTRVLARRRRRCNVIANEIYLHLARWRG